MVCAAGALDRRAIDELRDTLLAHLRHCVEGAAIICDLSQARFFEPPLVTRMLSRMAVRAAGRAVCLFVLPCPGLRRSSTATVPGTGAAGSFIWLDDIDDGVRKTGDPELQRDEHQVRRILDRTIRHCLRDLRGQPPHDTLDPATRQALRWRLTDAAHAGVSAGPRLLSVAAGVHRALTSLNARQHRDAYFAVLDAEDLLACRADPTPGEPTPGEPTPAESTPAEPTPAEPTSLASPSSVLLTPRVPAPRAASARELRTGSGPVGGTRRRVVIATRPSRRPQPAGGSR
ncbi:hypothetical protein [Actinomycetospora sp. CA-053990]|uniref:hypothetical protein n=1 Tax=Actinomycetospora sp. CA-053990 TaxID=3239891 RepID=UPI003D8B72F8